jgi:hypothetical protein
MPFPYTNFDAETVALMGRAFDAAWSELESQHLIAEESQAARSAVARAIMAAVVDGERDHLRLVTIALLSLATAGSS